MRDAQAISLMVAILLAVPAFLLRLRDSNRQLWRLLVCVAMGVNMGLAADSDHGAWHWIELVLSVVWWFYAIGCWKRMEKAREREAFAARFREELRKPRNWEIR